MAERIVKGGLGRGRGKPVQFTDFEADGRKITEHARADAEKLLERVRVEADRLRETARRAGFEEGRQAGLEQVRAEAGESSRAAALAEARAQMAPALAAMGELAAAFERTLGRYQATAHDELVALALDVARKVIGREIQLDPELVAGTVRRAVDLVLDKHKLTIRVHPLDQELLERAFPEVEALLGRTGWRLQPDERLQRGGALVGGEAGEVDARIETQLAEISRALCRSKEEGS